MSHRCPQRQTRKHPRPERRLFLWFLMAFGFTAAAAMAQAVYRCGNEYSDALTCPHGSVASVQDARSHDQHQAQDRLTQQTQAQADTLERNRLKSEKHMPHATPVPGAWPAKDLTVMQDTADSGSPGTPTHHTSHKRPGAYFTAKDGASQSKKVSAKKAKPKASADTPNKP